MSILFDPSGVLNVAQDASDLPESGDRRDSQSDALVRAKNVRLNEKGKAKTRDGSTKLNASAIEAAIWWLEEQGGNRYAFAGTQIYENESSIATGLTSAQWSAIKYNSYNDTVENIFALNGTDRKRIESGAVYEWGIAAPTDRPTLSAGQGQGLTGQFNAKYSYVRKSDSGAVLNESAASPAASIYQELDNGSLQVDVTVPADSQVTHIRLYRTLADGLIYYQDQDIPSGEYSHGVSHEWEGDDGYISGSANKFTYSDSTNGTDNTYTWEESYDSAETEDAPGYGDDGAWYTDSDDAYQAYLEYLQSIGVHYPGWFGNS